MSFALDVDYFILTFYSTNMSILDKFIKVAANGRQKEQKKYSPLKSLTIGKQYFCENFRVVTVKNNQKCLAVDLEDNWIILPKHLYEVFASEKNETLKKNAFDEIESFIYSGYNNIHFIKKRKNNNER